MPNQGNQPWVVPETEIIPDLTPGELHFMAQAELARLKGQELPRYVQWRADEVLARLAGQTDLGRA